MSKRSKKKNYVNGYHTNKDWIKLVVDKTAFDLYQREFNTGRDGSKCPPVDLQESGMCFYCTLCQNEAAGYVKEYKKHYMVKNIKYLKEELNDE